MRNFQTIELKIDECTAYLTLNRPQVCNAMNSLMISELLDAAMLIDSQAVTITVFRGNGVCFCSGVDIREKASFSGKTKEEQTLASEQFVDVFFRIASMKSIVIGLANGHVVGGGIGLLAACDIVLADPKAQFSVTATKIGILPAAMSTVLVQALGIRWAKFLSLSGRMIDAFTALQVGLVHIIAEYDLDVCLNEMLNLLGDGDEHAILATKQLYERFEQDYHSASRALRLSLVQNFTATDTAQARFSRYIQQGVFWSRV